jgi:hypothetical protein
MHIHGNPMQFNAANLHTAAVAEKTAATERATEVRKKLLDGGLDIDGGLNTESGLAVARRSGGNSQQQLGRNQGENPPNPLTTTGIEESEPAGKPLSFWA